MVFVPMNNKPVYFSDNKAYNDIYYKVFIPLYKAYTLMIIISIAKKICILDNIL